MIVLWSYQYLMWLLFGHMCAQLLTQQNSMYTHTLKLFSIVPLLLWKSKPYTCDASIVIKKRRATTTRFLNVTTNHRNLLTSCISTNCRCLLYFSTSDNYLIMYFWNQLRPIPLTLLKKYYYFNGHGLFLNFLSHNKPTVCFISSLNGGWALWHCTLVSLDCSMSNTRPSGRVVQNCKILFGIMGKNTKCMKCRIEKLY